MITKDQLELKRMNMHKDKQCIMKGTFTKNKNHKFACTWRQFENMKYKKGRDFHFNDTG